MKNFALALIIALAPSLATAGIVFNYETGKQLYVRFDDSSNTAVNLTEGSTLKAGRYTAADAAIDTAGLAAGNYTGRIFIGTAGAQSSSDVLVGVVNDFTFGASTQTSSDSRLISALFSTATADSGDGTVGRTLHWLEAAFTSIGRYSSSALANAPTGSGGSGTVIPVNQVPVPASRTWVLKSVGDGLEDEESRSMKVGETKVFAIDFAADLPTNGRLSSVELIETVDGSGGVTFADEDTDPGVDKTQAKVSITAETAGTYEISCEVGYQDGDGGGTAKGVVTLVVTE